MVKPAEVGGVTMRAARASSVAATVRVTGIVLQFALQVMAARLLGLHEYGVYLFALTTVTVFSLAGRLGYDASALRFVSAYATDTIANQYLDLLKCVSATRATQGQEALC